MNPRPQALILLLLTLVPPLGCNAGGAPDGGGGATSRPTPVTSSPRRPNTPVLHLDERYKREIHFEDLDLTVPIEKEGWYFRSDGPVEDVAAHQDALFAEVGHIPRKIVYTNSAKYGRSTAINFANGVRCAFIWVKQDDGPLITHIRLQHEKYHAVMRVCPERIGDLTDAVRRRGFDVDLSSLEEELAASVVEILSLHLQGVPLEVIGGSELTIQARDLLLEARTSRELSALKPILHLSPHAFGAVGG